MDSVGQVYGLSQRVNEHSQSGNGHSRRVNGRNGGGDEWKRESRKEKDKPWVAGKRSGSEKSVLPA